MSSPRKSASTIFLLFSLVFFLQTFIQAYESDQAFYPEPYQTPLPGYKYQKALVAQKGHNVIDSCWRKDPNWSDNREDLADCAKGFGSGALGGKSGVIYVVTDSSDDPADPRLGTLRYAATKDEPLWIIFKNDMSIKLKDKLLVSSFKTIDGRGSNVTIGNGGPCLVFHNANHIIIHGVAFVGCKSTGGITNRDDLSAVKTFAEGNAISVISSAKIWIDHCRLANATNGLIDVVLGSKAVTISNNFFTQQDKVMLLGHSDTFASDKTMDVTVAFNHFGPGCMQRMPRVRLGYVHIANNRYTEWGKYAIGGSANPTVMSEGNFFVAGDDNYAKLITRREVFAGDKPPPREWRWRSFKDVKLNGAYFVQSGSASNVAPLYTGYQAFPVAAGEEALKLTEDAGPLPCVIGEIC